MSKIVITNPVFAETRRMLEAYGDVVENRNLEPWPAKELRAHLSDARALLAFMTDSVDAEMLSAAPHLDIVACALKGYDNFDVEACAREGVWVSIVPDLLTAPTAELAIALMLGLSRKVLCGDQLVRHENFRGWRAQLYGLGLERSTVGILGYGKVGTAIAIRLQGFGARVIAYDPKCQLGQKTAEGAEFVPIDTLQSASDFVVVALPLTGQTHHFVDRHFLSRLQPHVCLVNVGRGSVVNEKDVAEALQRDDIGGYAADVFEFEDWSCKGHPDHIDPRLLADPARTLFTPHLGSAVERTRREIELRAAENIVDVLNGKTPRDAINSPHRR